MSDPIDGNTDAPAIVNGVPLTHADLIRWARRQEPFLFLRSAIRDEIARQEAAERGIVVTEQELQSAATRFRVERGLEKASEMVAWLDAHALTVDEWQSALERRLVTAKLRDEIAAEGLEPYFAENRLTFDRAIVSQIVVASEDLARELRSQVSDDGADFHALARRHSLDETSRPMGGYTGAVARDDLDPVSQAAVYGASPAAVVGPFRYEKMWRLILVEEIRRATQDDATRSVIADILYERWLDERLRKASVELRLAEAE